MSKHTNSRLKIYYKIGVSQNDHGQTSIFDEPFCIRAWRYIKSSLYLVTY